ncbi:MAG: tetratricopeptide repeat protein [Leptospirales bacterium]
MKIRKLWAILFFGGISFLGLFFIPSKGEYVRLAIQSRNYDLAHHLLKPFLSKKNPPAWALSDGARVEIRRGFPEKAALYLEKLLAQTPRNTPERLRLARLYLSMNHPRRALLHYAILSRQRAVPLKTFKETVRLNDLLNHSQSVLSLYHHMLKIDPRNKDLWKELVTYDRESGNIVDERNTLEALVRTHPHRQDYLRELISLNYSLGDYRSVVASLLALSSIKGDVAPILEESIRSFVHLGKTIQGYLLYRKIRNDVASPEELEGIAWIFYHHQYKTLSLSVFMDLAERAPANRSYRDDEIWLSEQLGWFDQARGFLLKTALDGLDTPENSRARILDLDLRFHRWGVAQSDLIGWLGETRSSLSVLRLFSDYAQDRNNLPLSISMIRQANTLYPGNRSLEESLATLYRWDNQPGNAGALLLALSLSSGATRQSLLLAARQFEDAGLIEPAKGIMFRIVSQDTVHHYMNDLDHLFTLFDQSPVRTGLTRLASVSSRFPDRFGSRDLLIAQTFIWEKRVRSAKRTIDALIRAYPGNRALLFRASQWFADLGHPELAIHYDWAAYRMNTADISGILRLIRHLRWLGQDKDLPRLYHQILKVNPDNSQALAYEGEDLYDHGRYAQSILYFRRLLRTGKASHREVFMMAKSYDRLGNRKKARKYYRLTLNLLSLPSGAKY